MKVSVVIPCFRGLRTLGACLQALREQQVPADEVLVVDSSDDATPDMVRRDFPELRLIHLDQQTLPGPARNIGVRAAEGDVIGMLDADCLPAPDWIATARAELADPSVTAIAGPILNGTPRSVAGTLLYQAEFNEHTRRAPRRPVRMAPTANMVVRRAACLDVPFRADLFPAEDVVFARDLAAAGHRIRFVPELRITHQNKTDWGQIGRSQRHLGKHYARSRRRFPDLPGRGLVDRPWLLPAVPAVRYGLMMKRFIRYGDWPAAATALAAAPLHLGLGAIWAVGFWEELKEEG